MKFFVKSLKNGKIVHPGTEKRKDSTFEESEKRKESNIWERKTEKDALEGPKTGEKVHENRRKSTSEA